MPEMGRPWLFDEPGVSRPGQGRPDIFERCKPLEMERLAGRAS